MSDASEMFALLQRMKLLSDVPAAQLERTHAGKSEDRPPQGYGQTTNDKGEPDEHWSLHEHYKHRWEHATSDRERKAVIVRARSDLRRRIKGAEAWRGEKLSNTDSEANERENVRILLDHGEGVHCVELAAEMEAFGWNVQWVKIQRERNGKEPEFGRERPKWSVLSKEERFKVAARMANAGTGLRPAARELGIAVTSLQHYWPKQSKEAA